MSTTRTRSALLTLGAMLSSTALLIAACTGSPPAAGTLPMTPEVTSPAVSSDVLSTTPESSPSVQTTETSGPTSENVTASTEEVPVETKPEESVVVTVPTDDIHAPANIPEPVLDVPAGATQRTVGGASDFVRWWYQLGSASAKMGSNATIKEFTGADCAECGVALNTLDNFLAAGDQSYTEGDSPWALVV